MPDLAASLQGQDLGHLQVVARLWRLQELAGEPRQALLSLVAALLDPEQAQEQIAELPLQAQSALAELALSGGRVAWAYFSRKYGSIREMGPGRREREQPYLNPASAAEVLWYRALLARAFFDTPDGPQEFAYIPDDLLALLPPVEGAATPALGRPAFPVERDYVIAGSDRILDHICTYLAALRMQFPVTQIDALVIGWQALSQAGIPNETAGGAAPLSREALHALCVTAGLLDVHGNPDPERVRNFLEADRGIALAHLVQAWKESHTFNELRMMPTLNAEGNWENDPLRTRQTLLGFLTALPAGIWWSLPGFVTALKEQSPDFQRPAGDYDSWFLRDRRSGEFLRGFESWDQVDGALVRFLLAGPMHWLGLLDLAAPGPDRAVTAFRLSAWADMLLQGKPAPGLPAEDARLLVASDARLRMPRLVPRVARYQLARFCAWEEESEAGYAYRLTPAALERARQAGLSINHLLALLRRYAEHIPPSLPRALERWNQHGPEASLERVLVLRLASPDLLQALRASRAARYLGDPLGPTAIIVKSGAEKKIFAILAEMGYLGESKTES
jgi:hypothetical protein